MAEHRSSETASWDTTYVPRHYGDEQPVRRPLPRPRVALLSVDTCDQLMTRLGEAQRRADALAQRLNGDLHPLVMAAYGPPSI